MALSVFQIIWNIHVCYHKRDLNVWNFFQGPNGIQGNSGESGDNGEEVSTYYL